MAKHTKLELVCELCGTQLIKLEIHKGMLACDFCLSSHKRREQRKKEDLEWDRMIAKEKEQKSS